MSESGGTTAPLQKRPAHSKIVARANGVLPVAECFTASALRVSVFSRTAIHAPGGWALIENLPHVLTGDRVTVGLTSTYLLPQKNKGLVSLARSTARVDPAQQFVGNTGDRAAVGAK